MTDKQRPLRRALLALPESTEVEFRDTFRSGWLNAAEFYLAQRMGGSSKCCECQKRVLRGDKYYSVFGRTFCALECADQWLDRLRPEAS